MFFHPYNKRSYYGTLLITGEGAHFVWYVKCLLEFISYLLQPTILTITHHWANQPKKRTSFNDSTSPTFPTAFEFYVNINQKTPPAPLVFIWKPPHRFPIKLLKLLPFPPHPSPSSTKVQHLLRPQKKNGCFQLRYDSGRWLIFVGWLQSEELHFSYNYPSCKKVGVDGSL